MYRLTLWITLIAFALPTAALAKKLEKMDNEELIDALQTAKDEDDRADAAELLGERKVEAAIGPLAERCIEDEDDEVCKTSVRALVEIGTDEALTETVKILENADVDQDGREVALKQLLKNAPERADASIPACLATYRKLDNGFNKALIKGMVDRDLEQFADITVLIAKDETIKRLVRLAALEAAESFNHPMLFDAYIALLDDKDKKLRIKACQGLGRSGMPGSIVAPKLEDVAKNDEKGGVRGAAWKSLKKYTHKGLLPTIHWAVLNEKDPIAWTHAVEMLVALADASSLDTIHQVMLRDEYITTEGTVELIHLLVRIGDPSSEHPLASLEDRTKDNRVEDEAQLALKFFRDGKVGDGNVTPVITADVVLWDPDAEQPEVPTLKVEMDSNGVVVWIEE
jgi:HEAT repeat protein